MLKIIRSFFTLALFMGIYGGIKLITMEPFWATKQTELNVFVYSGVFDLDMIDRFEEETGIKVNLHFFTTNEELLTKLQFSSGKGSGIDLLFPCDFGCKILNDRGYLAPIDKSKLTFLDRIYPYLLHQTFDPNNDFSIPFVWEAYGIGYNPDIIKKDNLSLDDLFDERYQKVTTPDIVELIDLAAYHLYGDIESITQSQGKEITKLLIKQKETMEAYADFRAKDLLCSKAADIALLKTSFVTSLKEGSDLIKFTLPTDAIFLSIQCAVISNETKNHESIYKFLNFLYDPKNLALTTDQFPSYPACPDAFEHTSAHHKEFIDAIDEIKDRKEDIRFFLNLCEIKQMQKIFIDAKT
jgi:spermidine/putrescine transport system substrate-binding protein